MAAASPPPNSSTPAVPLPSTTSQSPLPSTPATPSTTSPPPTVPAAPPPVTQSTPPPVTSSPPPPTIADPPPTSSPPPSRSGSPPLGSPPPPPSPTPPSANPPPPPSSIPPTSSPPPPVATPPKSSPPPPVTTPPPQNSSRPAPTPPANSPSPPSNTSGPPASTSPLPPSRSSPPPPSPIAPTPLNAPPPPPRLSPPTSQPTPSPSNSSQKASPPPLRLASPPSSLISPPSAVTNSIPESSNSSGNGGLGAGGVVAIGVAVGIIVLSLIGFAVWCMRKQKKKISGLTGVYVVPSPMGSPPTSDSIFSKTQSATAPLIPTSSGSDFAYSPNGSGGLGNSRPWFTYDELVKATNGFSSQNFLGEGGFGSVYKGRLEDEREVAVKQLKIGGDQGEREFKAEVEIISRIHHRHLVSLVGYCISANQRLLVYDYVPNNTLHFHLHGQGRPVLEWVARVKIAAGAARGIAYLHEDCHPRIIHRDIKSSNILLDNNYEAKVSDFGLAKLALDTNTHVTTRVMGTFGYMAPEYATSGKLTEKSDVFSYGVVLLELITGRKPVDASQPLGEESLVEWARPLLTHAIDNEDFGGLVDPRLEKNFVGSEMLLMVEAAAACVRHSAARRPRMGQVVRAFDGLATADLSNGMRVGESEVYNSAQASEEIRWFRRMAFGSQKYSTEYLNQLEDDR